jgi:hypothetical protein
MTTARRPYSPPTLRHIGTVASAEVLDSLRSARCVPRLQIVAAKDSNRGEGPDSTTAIPALASNGGRTGDAVEDAMLERVDRRAVFLESEPFVMCRSQTCETCRARDPHCNLVTDPYYLSPHRPDRRPGEPWTFDAPALEQAPRAWPVGLSAAYAEARKHVDHDAVISAVEKWNPSKGSLAARARVRESSQRADRARRHERDHERAAELRHVGPHWVDGAPESVAAFRPTLPRPEDIEQVRRLSIWDGRRKLDLLCQLADERDGVPAGHTERTWAAMYVATTNAVVRVIMAAQSSRSEVATPAHVARARDHLRAEIAVGIGAALPSRMPTDDEATRLLTSKLTLGKTRVDDRLANRVAAWVDDVRCENGLARMFVADLPRGGPARTRHQVEWSDAEQAVEIARPMLDIAADYGPDYYAVAKKIICDNSRLGPVVANVAESQTDTT